MKYIICLLSVFIFLSCSLKKRNINIKKTTNLEYLGEYIEDFTLGCMGTQPSDDAHMHVKFNINDTSLTLYIGKSISDFSQKWNVPLKDIQLDSSNLEASVAYEEIRISGLNQKSPINYSYTEEKNTIYKMNNSLSIYLFSVCGLEKQDTFKLALKRIIKLSKR